MSKELYFTDGNNEVKYLDTTASFNLAITQDGSAYDLTNATAIDVKVANDTGYVFDKSIDMATIKQPLAGLITMPVDAEVMNALVPDDYTIEVWVTLSSLITPGSQEGLTDDGSTTDTTTSTTDTTTYNAIFPSDDPQGFTITENVMSDSGDVIPVMSLDAFQQEFDQLKTDLTNKVATLQGPAGKDGENGKDGATGPQGPQGIQGPKGDTGQGLEIKGKVDTTSQLPATASEGDGYLVAEELYIWTNNAWKDCGQIQGPAGKDGATGPQGPQGPAGKDGTQVDLSNYATQQQLAAKADADSIGLVNLIYNSQYSNSGDGWKLYPGAYYSDSDISSYNGSLGLGFSKAGNTVSAPVAMSKPMPLVGDGTVIPTDVYSARVKAKIYSDSSSDTKFILTIAFLDSTSTRIGYRETFVTPDTSEDWQDVKVLGAGVPTGTSNIQIQFYTQGTLAHGMFVNPMLVKGPVVGPYQPDTIGMADVTGFATKTDVTTAISAATANMVDSSKATNFTNGLQSGGVDVATAADLKSIEDSAWRQLDNKYISTKPTSNTTISSNTVILYKIDTGNKRIYLQGTILISSNVTNDLSTSVSIDFSSIAKTISYASGYYALQYWGNSPISLYGSSILNDKLTMTSTNFGSVSIADLSSSNQPSTAAYVTYDELV
ncbi:hypothetical protein CNR29_08600 [Levilactobacillus brevis]|uniref:Collagen-like protein n=1 Tax=Levilactobacillus brevis TaxID=1580 RepID=A0A2A3TZN2_LEVBR|nr:collagen-like protein [Levilactobacillus brevis]PBQ24076.1 hypothetical protein CNR29_08600 [Levilactobacillus brevis]